MPLLYIQTGNNHKHFRAHDWTLFLSSFYSVQAQLRMRLWRATSLRYWCSLLFLCYTETSCFFVDRSSSRATLRSRLRNPVSKKCWLNLARSLFVFLLFLLSLVHRAKSIPTGGANQKKLVSFVLFLPWLCFCCWSLLLLLVYYCSMVLRILSVTSTTFDRFAYLLFSLYFIVGLFVRMSASFSLLV